MKVQRTFGEILKSKRKANNWTQSELAKKLGTHQNMIALYERNKVNPTLFILTDLADIFECSLDELVGRVSPKQTNVYIIPDDLVINGITFTRK